MKKVRILEILESISMDPPGIPAGSRLFFLPPLPFSMFDNVVAQKLFSPIDPAGGGGGRPPLLDPAGGGDGGAPLLDPAGGGGERPPLLDPAGEKDGPPLLDPAGGGGERPPLLDPAGGGGERPPLLAGGAKRKRDASYHQLVKHVETLEEELRITKAALFDMTELNKKMEEENKLVDLCIGRLDEIIKKYK